MTNEISQQNLDHSNNINSFPPFHVIIDNFKYTLKVRQLIKKNFMCIIVK